MRLAFADFCPCVGGVVLDHVVECFQCLGVKVAGRVGVVVIPAGDLVAESGIVKGIAFGCEEKAYAVIPTHAPLFRVTGDTKVRSDCGVNVVQVLALAVFLRLEREAIRHGLENGFVLVAVRVDGEGVAGG